jgi:hypothetical protein
MAPRAFPPGLSRPALSARDLRRIVIPPAKNEHPVESGRGPSMDVDTRFHERLKQIQETFERELAAQAERLQTKVDDQLEETRKEIAKRLGRR